MNEIVGVRLPFDARKTASTIRTIERSTAWPNIRVQVSPRARAAREGEGHRHADHEHERRLDQVPEDTAAPCDMVELMSEARRGMRGDGVVVLDETRRARRRPPTPSPASRNPGRHRATEACRFDVEIGQHEFNPLGSSSSSRGRIGGRSSRVCRL